MTTVAVYSIKGGVGKSTVSVNLAVLAAKAGQRTILLDLDPLGSSSYLLSVQAKKSHDEKALVKGGKELTKQIQATKYASLDVLPSSLAYKYLSIKFDEKKNSKHRLEKRLDDLSQYYDLAIIDASPTMSLVNENVLYAADVLLVPVVPTPFAVIAYDTLAEELKRMQILKHRVYVAVSMLDKRKKLHIETAEELLKRPESLKTIIPFASEIEKMGERREPVVEYKPRGKGAQAFKSLYRELTVLLRAIRDSDVAGDTAQTIIKE